MLSEVVFNLPQAQSIAKKSGIKLKYFQMMQIKSITSRTAKDTDIWRLLIITITTMKNHFVKIIKTAI